MEEFFQKKRFGQNFYVVDEDKAVITVLRILNDGRDWMSIIKNGYVSTELNNRISLYYIIGKSI